MLPAIAERAQRGTEGGGVVGIYREKKDGAYPIFFSVPLVEALIFRIPAFSHKH